MANPNMVIQNMTGTPHVVVNDRPAFMVVRYGKKVWDVTHSELVDGGPMVMMLDVGAVEPVWEGGFKFTAAAEGVERGWVDATGRTKPATVRAAAKGVR